MSKRGRFLGCLTLCTLALIGGATLQQVYAETVLCVAMTAGDVVWNLERVTNEKAPQFHPKQFAMIRDRTSNMEKVEALDDYTIALTTRQVDALFPYQLSYWFMISRCQLESLKYDYAAYQQHPSGTGAYEFPIFIPQ